MGRVSFNPKTAQKFNNKNGISVNTYMYSDINKVHVLKKFSYNEKGRQITISEDFIKSFCNLPSGMKKKLYIHVCTCIATKKQTSTSALHIPPFLMITRNSAN